jgi:hypothetical protein
VARGAVAQMGSRKILVELGSLPRGGYAGPDVCEVCVRESPMGVYRVPGGDWVCPKCKAARPKIGKKTPPEDPLDEEKGAVIPRHAPQGNEDER